MLIIFGENLEFSEISEKYSRTHIEHNWYLPNSLYHRHDAYSTIRRIFDHTSFKFQMLICFVEILKFFEIHANSRPNMLRRYRDWPSRPRNIQGEYSTILIPSGCVTRAETWLTVYRSLYIASCRFSGRAPIRKFRCEILDDAASFQYKC